MESVRGIVSRILNEDLETGRMFLIAHYEAAGKLVPGKFGSFGKGVKEGDAFVCDGAWRATKFRGAPETIFDGRLLRPDVPRTRAGAEVYLLSIFYDRKYCVTKASVNAFLDREGPQALKMAVDRPEIISGVSTHPRECRDAIQSEWMIRTKGCLAVSLLEQSGVDMKAIDRIIGRWRNETYEILKKNPYAVADKNVGFVTLDKIGRKLGIPKSDPRRLAGAMNEVLRAQSGRGSTTADIETLLKEIGEIDGIGRREILSFLEGSGRTGQDFTIRQLPEGPVCSLNQYFQAEGTIANGLMALLSRGRPNSVSAVRGAAATLFATKGFDRLDEIQRIAVMMAATEPVSIVTGGPGTGKSTVMDAVAKLVEKLDNGPIYLVAPTGKAAKRLHETTNRPTSTIHRCLKPRGGPNGPFSTFSMNAANPLPPGTVMIVDEVSLIDVDIMAALVTAIPLDGRLILVGDKDQLPSVGPGAVLADMLGARIGSKRVISCVSLSNVYRTSKDSLIATGAKTIREGGVPKIRDFVDGGVCFTEVPTYHIVEEVERLVCDTLPALGFDPIRDVAVLCPQAPGTAGTWEINRRLQARLNPRGAEIPGIRAGVDDDTRRPLPRVGDRVMLTENDSEKDVVNGDLGIITGTQKNEAGRHVMTVKFDCGTEVNFPTTKWRSLDLAYAGTIHKSQGSQFKVVVIPMATSHEKMHERTLVYTGWSRAQEYVYLIGERRCFENAIANTKSSHRSTFLKGFLSGWPSSALDRGGRPDWSADAAKAQEAFDANQSTHGNDNIVVTQPAARFGAFRRFSPSFVPSPDTTVRSVSFTETTPDLTVVSRPPIIPSREGTLTPVSPPSSAPAVQPRRFGAFRPLPILVIKDGANDSTQIPVIIPVPAPAPAPVIPPKRFGAFRPFPIFTIVDETDNGAPTPSNPS